MPILASSLNMPGCRRQCHGNARSQPGSSAVSEMTSPPGTCRERKPGAEPPGWLWALPGPAQLTLSLGCSAWAGFNVCKTLTSTYKSKHWRYMLSSLLPLWLHMARSQPRYLYPWYMLSISIDTDNYIDNSLKRESWLLKVCYPLA